MPRSFSREFSQASGVFQMAEVWHGDDRKLYGYQEYVEGAFNFPLKYAIKDVFGNQKRSFELLSEKMALQKSLFKDVDLLGVFLDNHDEARFLWENKQPEMLQNALIYSLTTRGIPFVYYGSEFLYEGGHDPNNRESLW